MIAWNKSNCCEMCGDKDYFVSDRMKISGRRIRLCKKCLSELRDAIDETFGDLLTERIISEKEIELVNELIVQSIKHGGDSGGPYFTNEKELISAINAWLEFKENANGYQIAVKVEHGFPQIRVITQEIN